MGRFCDMLSIENVADDDFAPLRLHPPYPALLSKMNLPYAASDQNPK